MKNRTLVLFISCDGAMKLQRDTSEHVPVCVEDDSRLRTRELTTRLLSHLQQQRSTVGIPRWDNTQFDC